MNKYVMFLGSQAMNECEDIFLRTTKMYHVIYCNQDIHLLWKSMDMSRDLVIGAMHPTNAEMSPFILEGCLKSLIIGNRQLCKHFQST